MFRNILKKPIEFVKNNIEIILTVGTATATIEVSASLYFYYKIIDKIIWKMPLIKIPLMI